MSLYNIEFFDRKMNCTHHAEANFTYIESDYLAPESSAVEIIKTDKVNVQDIVYIRELPDYVGIVDAVEQNEYTTTVRIKPFLTVFDQPITYDTDRQYGDVTFVIGSNPIKYDNYGFHIFLKPSKYKFGLFNAGGEGGTAFKNINDINRDKIRFVAKFGCNKFDASKNRIYGPRVCVDGTVSQPDVGSGTYLYYMLDGSGKSDYGKWDRNMRKEDEWFRKNVQMCCSPDIIFSKDLEQPLTSYSAYGVSQNVSNNWAFFGKDRHGRFFCGYNGLAKATPTQIWNMLTSSCGITELAFMGCGVTENDLSSGTFLQPKDVGEEISWLDDELHTWRNNGALIGDTLAFYEVLSDNEDENINPAIPGRYQTVDVHKGDSLEFEIEMAIRRNWVTREGERGWANDKLMEWPVYCGNATSSTKDWTLSIEPDNYKEDQSKSAFAIVEFYQTFLQEAFRKYRIALSCRIDWSFNNIEIIIGRRSDPVHIETDLPYVKVKEFVVETPQNTINKLEILDNDNSSKRIEYFLHPDGTYDTHDTNRIFPVVRKIISIDTAGNEIPFNALAERQAKAEFDDIRWKNYIELEVYDPPEIQIGQLCYIHHNGEVYETVLSGFRDGDVKTLMFGAYRTEYTKSMKLTNMKQLADGKMVTKNAYDSKKSGRT